MGKLYPDDLRQTNLARLRNWKQIIENNKYNVMLKLERKMSSNKYSDYNNTTDIEFVARLDYYSELMLTEDLNFVPRFTIKKNINPVFQMFPPNKEIKYNRDLMIKAIEFGMIIMIQYRGNKDTFMQGHSRVVYPMVLGISAKGKPLLRGFHLRGWSVSRNGNIQKDWRLFRTDRILSMSFTGSFFRLPPAGYVQNDSAMTGGITIAADFDKIRNNQKTLIQKDLIQNKQEVIIDKEEKKTTVVEVDATNTVIDLEKPFENPNISFDDRNMIRISFLKNTQNGKYVAIIGALGQKGNVVKLTSRGKYLGMFKVLKSCMGDHLGKPHLRNIEGNKLFNLMVFVKKVN